MVRKAWISSSEANVKSFGFLGLGRTILVTLRSTLIALLVEEDCSMALESSGLQLKPEDGGE
jgi:hypothetical protein